MQLTMRTRLAPVVAAIAAALLIVVGVLAAPAEARSRTDADDALVARLLGHADKIAAILEQHQAAPKKGLAALDRYLKKHRKAMKRLVTQIVAAAGELDEDARRAWAREVMFGEPAQRFVAALTAFVDAHGDDPAHAKTIQARMDELTSEGKKLAAALLR